MVIYLIFLNFLLMLIMPLVLGWFIASRRPVSWKLFGVGVVGFVLSQILHIPFNFLVLEQFQLFSPDHLIVYAVFLGLSAGVFEEMTRWLIYRNWITQARSWGQGLMYGAGWGGIESILLGAVGLLNLVILVGINYGYFLQLVPPDQVDLVGEQIAALFDLPMNMALLGAVERLFALCFHLAASVMVLQVFLRENKLWLLAAVLWHALLNALGVYAVFTWGAWQAEAIVGVMALISLAIIFWLRTPEPAEPEPEPLIEVGPAKPTEQDLSESALEKSKYS